jgi:hypothetical protein
LLFFTVEGRCATFQGVKLVDRGSTTVMPSANRRGTGANEVNEEFADENAKSLDRFKAIRNGGILAASWAPDRDVDRDVAWALVNSTITLMLSPLVGASLPKSQR